MKKFSVVRVYSKSLEQNVCPIPGSLAVTRKCIVLPEPDEVDHLEPPDTVLLHKLIRDEKCPLYEQIRAMDERIKNADPRGANIPDKELEEYRRQIKEAEKHVLTNADVILCTCSESASKRISKATNIQQVEYFAVNDYILKIITVLGILSDCMWKQFTHNTLCLKKPDPWDILKYFQPDINNFWYR